MWPRMDHRRLNIIFLNFLNLLDVHLSQFGITFGKHLEIHFESYKIANLFRKS
jgi:hypothetical protein